MSAILRSDGVYNGCEILRIDDLNLITPVKGLCFGGCTSVLAIEVG